MLLITAIGVVVTIAGVYIAYLTYLQGESPAPTGAGPATPTLTASPSTSSSPHPESRTASVLCGSPESGASLDCHDAKASLRVSQPACDARSILALWGLDPDLDALDLVLNDKGDTCWVRPGEVALRSGVSAADLVQASAGHVTDALRQCAAGKDLVATSCTQAHQIEWIGEWVASDTTPASMSCQQKATEYTRMTLAGMENRLVAESAERTAGGVHQTRCLVRVDGIVLDGSLRSLKNGQLPQAPEYGGVAVPTSEKG